MSSIIDKKYAEQDCEYDINTRLNIKDLKITYAFKGLETYYLNCRLNPVNSSSGEPQILTIKLQTTDTIGNVIREQIIKEYKKPYGFYANTQIELTFTPKTDFSKIIFEFRNEKVDSKNSQYFMFSSIFNTQLFLVNNILNNVLNIDSAFKIGIQGPTDLIVCCNGEPIRLGQSGVFEVYKEDFIIHSIGFIPRLDSNNINSEYSFLMDYCY